MLPKLNSTRSVCFVALCLMAPMGAYAQATRTWVSGVGDDANPCSRTAPCKTFAGAISKTAAGGEIDAIDPGGFGAVTITKSMTLDGSNVLAGVLVAGTAGIIINAGVNDIVTLRGLDINGVGSGTKGIQIIQAGKVFIDNCEVYNFTPRGISIEPASSPVIVQVNNTRLRHSASNGIVVAPANGGIKATVTLTNVVIGGSTNFGLSVIAGGNVVVRNSAITDSGVATGASNIRVDGAASVDLDNVLISGGAVGILSLNGAAVRVSNSSVINNGTGLSGPVLSFNNNRLTGNIVNGSFSGTIALQ
jgi:hypothetical protein